jgi:hypothetical protein
MGASKATPAEAAFVQYADKIDDDLLAAKPLTELRRVVYVTVLQRQAR